MKNRTVLFRWLGALLIPLLFIGLIYVSKVVTIHKYRTHIEKLDQGEGSYDEQQERIKDLRLALKLHNVTSEQLDVAQTSFSEDRPIRWIASLDTLSKYREARRHYEALKKMALHAEKKGGPLDVDDLLIAQEHSENVEQFREYFFGEDSPVSFKSFLYTSPSGEQKMCSMDEIGEPLNYHKKMLETCATGISWKKDFTSGP